jgi:hypothetical protein
MPRPLATRPIVCSLLVCLAAVHLAAADLQELTSRAYDRYAEQITQTFLERARAGVASTLAGTPSSREYTPRDGELIVHPGGQDGIIAVPGGLLHHWIGASFIAGATLAEGLDVSYAYDRYHDIYEPVIASRLLAREGNAYRVLLRVRESAAGLSAVLDVTAHVEYFYPIGGSSYSISRSEEIREVKDPGSPREQLLPAGHDSGYLWRAVTLNRLVERSDGLFIEMETLGLSRGFPPLLHWLIEPIARRLGRKSVELSLQEFRRAVQARKREDAGRVVSVSAT